MSTRIFTVLLMAGLVLLAAPALARETWTRFSYPEAGFSIELPGEPRVTLDPDSDRGGTDRRKYTLGEPKRVLLISSVKTGQRTLESLLATARDVSSADGRELIAQKVVIVQEVSGVESLVRSKTGNLMLHRIFYRRGRTLQFIVSVGPNDDIEAAGRRFHDSMRFLPE